MSECMTLDETIDQKETCAEINVKDIVEFILEEALNAADLFSEKDCSHIGDFNITEDFCQQFDQLPAYSKESEISKLSLNGNSSTANQEINLDSGESIDHSISIITARENLELILDSFIKKDEKVKNLSECKVISEEILADNELRIENGKIRIKNKPEEENKSFLTGARVDYFDKKNVIKDEKIEIEYFNDGKLNKIYVPLNKIDTDTSHPPIEAGITNEVSDVDRSDNITQNENNGKPISRPFSPCNTEELRQDWGNANSSIVGGWNGDMSAQSKEVVRLMVELSSTPVFQDISADPNRPRACAFAEEDVKKMTKEIEEINFNQSHLSLNEMTSCRSDGKGDSVVETERLVNEEHCEKQLFEEKKESFKPLNNMQNESLANVSIVNSKQILPIESTHLINSANFLENATLPEIENQKNEATNILSSTSNSVVFAQQTLTNIPSNKLRNDSIDNDLNLTSFNPSYTVFSEEKIIKNKNPRVICSTSQNAMPYHFQQNIDDKSNIFLTSSASKNLEKSQTEIKETEILSKDYCVQLDSAVHSYMLEEFHCEKTPTEFVPETPSVAVEENQEKESLNLYPLTKLSEVPLTESGPVPMNEKEKFSFTTNFTLQQDDSFSIKNDDENVEPEKVNQISYDSYGSYIYTYEPKSDMGECMNLGPEKNSSFTSKDLHSGSFVEYPKDENDGANYFNGDQLNSTQSKFNEYFKDEKLKNAAQEDFQKKGSTSVTTIESGPSQLWFSNNISESESNIDENFKGKNFKLHSQKMYFGANIDPASTNKPDLLLSHSEEAFIDLTENVIQIIEPTECSTEEITKKVSFSLFNESQAEQPPNNCTRKEESNCTNSAKSVESLMESNVRCEDPSEDEIVNKKVYSGMTTIGPLKIINHDPKDLTAVDIDYGKMTRITSSRQLAKDFFGVEIKSAPSIKITEDDSDEESITYEGGNIENATLVNRDIASLTKVQKVREVMSHHPKPEDDFEDDENLTRPRLDLKDVESMTDERCKVPDVSIQLLSFEVGDNNPEVEQEFIQNVNLVLSRNRFDAHNFYDDDPDEIQTQRNNNITEINYDTLLDLERGKEESNEENLGNKNYTTNFVTTTSSGNEIFINSTVLKGGEERSPERITESQFEANPSHHKCSTLGSVFKKASSRLIKKDDDFATRNSKSLPRDPNKVAKAESIKSVLDECHTSATNVLKKSHSLLKNTQGIFKTISQNRFNCHRSATSLNKDKLSPLELDVTNPEKKSSFIKKEDFLKAKQAIKEKMEKAFKNLNITPRSESEGSLGKKTFDVQNDENIKIDQTENSKKFLPKSPLIYKSQFVKSQINVQKNLFENNEMASPMPEEPKETIVQANENNKISVSHSSGVSSVKDETVNNEVKIPVESNTKDETFWTQEDTDFFNRENGNEQLEPQPEYIVMETVQGLQAPNLEGSSYLKEKPSKSERVQFLEEIGSRDKFMSAHSVAISDSKLQVKSDNFEEKSTRISNKENEKCEGKIHAEKKVRTKSKKFTARFRSFWCSAFGRVKSSSRNARNHS